MPDGTAIIVDNGQAELALRVRGCRLGEAAGEGRVEGAEAACLSGPLPVPGGGDEGDFKVPEGHVDLRRGWLGSRSTTVARAARIRVTTAPMPALLAYARAA